MPVDIILIRAATIILFGPVALYVMYRTVHSKEYELVYIVALILFSVLVGIMLQKYVASFIGLLLGLEITITENSQFHLVIGLIFFLIGMRINKKKS